MAARTTEGGTAPSAVSDQLKKAQARYLVDESAMNLLSSVVEMGAGA